MQETSIGQSNWPQFTRPDGTTIKCLIKKGYLELVIMVSPDGSTLDVDPDHVDIKMIEQGLHRKIKIH